MVIDWFRFVFRQLAIALAVVTSILLLSEILMPSSILPYFNLHILVLVTVVIALISPAIEEKSRFRIVLLIPFAVLLLAYAWLMFGTSTSGLALFAALAIVLVGVIVALSWRQREVMFVDVVQETIIMKGDELVADIVEEETSVFMR